MTVSAGPARQAALPPPAGPRRRAVRWFAGHSLARHGLAVVLGGLLVYLVTYVTTDYRDTQLAQAGYYVIALAGLTVLTGANGQVSLGHGGLLAVGAFTAALLDVHDPKLPILLVLLAAVAVTAVVGGLLGVAAARLSGPYLAGATLAFAVALPGLLDYFPNTFGSDTGLPAQGIVPPAFMGPAFSGPHWQAYTFSLAALLVLLLLANLLSSGVGRAWRAVRDDEVAAALAGIDVGRWKVAAFAVSAACAGLAGALLAIWLGTVDAGAFTLTLSLSLLTGAVIGGLGSLIGAVWGGLLLTFLPTWISDATTGLHANANVVNNLPDAVYGVILIAVILLAPGGIQGAARRLFSAMSRPVVSRRST